jgi:hypothetical protein
MPRHKVQDGVVISLTPAEETEADSRDAEYALKLPLKLWKISMEATDSTCPRWFEDYVTENSVALTSGKSKDSYDAKVALRGQKP